MLELYLRAALQAIPVLGGGRGDTLPDLRPARTGVQADPHHLAAYDRVCGFRLRNELPSTYLHVLAFPLALRLLVDRAFPFGTLGVVHVANRIVQHRPLALGERFDLAVTARALQPHRRGRTVELVGEARVADQLVWEDVSTYLHREPRAADASDAATAGDAAAPDPGPATPDPLPERARWRVGGDIGRRYAAVSGDRNPIHLHPLSAKAFGLPRPIAHGMWVKARCLAALEATTGSAYAVDVRFRAPLLLPATVALGAGDDGAFSVRVPGGDRCYVEGRISSP